MSSNVATVSLSTRQTDRRDRGTGGGFFSHHGPWAPGVRMFRAQQFKAKAAIVSAFFIIPILALSVAQFMNARDVIDFADKERSGVSTMRPLMLVFESVLEVRNATRSGRGGFDAAADYLRAREKTDKSIAALRQAVRASADPLALAPTIAKLEAAWRAPIFGAMQVAKCIRHRVSELRVPLGSHKWRGSVSGGVAARGPVMAGPDDLLKAADQGLYVAKRAGRDRVESVCGST